MASELRRRLFTLRSQGRSGFVQNRRFTGTKLGSRRPEGTVMLRRGTRGADSLKIHLWQQSNKWPCLCSGPALPPCGHSSSATIELHGPRSLFIILSQSLLSSFTYCLRDFKKNLKVISLLVKKRSSFLRHIWRLSLSRDDSHLYKIGHPFTLLQIPMSTHREKNSSRADFFFFKKAKRNPWSENIKDIRQR